MRARQAWLQVCSATRTYTLTSRAAWLSRADGPTPSTPRVGCRVTRCSCVLRIALRPHGIRPAVCVCNLISKNFSFPFLTKKKRKEKSIKKSDCNMHSTYNEISAKTTHENSWMKLSGASFTPLRASFTPKDEMWQFAVVVLSTAIKI